MQQSNAFQHQAKASKRKKVRDKVGIVKQNIIEDSQYGFWAWQISFWIFLSITSFLTLTLWYSNPSVENIQHTILQGLVGFLFSIVLYKIFTGIWDKSIKYRTIIGGFFVFFIAFVWTLIRMYLLAWLTDFTDLWDEFGGWFFASLFIFLCWAGLFHGIRYYYLQQIEHQSVLQAEAATRDEQIKRIEAQSIARDFQLKMLRYQLNPHFLSNSLNAINSLIEIGESNKAQKMTIQLSQFLRYSLDNDPDTMIALEKEISATNLYLEIEKTRFGDRLDIEFNIAQETFKALVPSLLLQPIIENSMKHAIAKNESGGKIKITSYINDARLILSISDTGAQANNNLLLESSDKGVGLKNIKQRLKALYNQNHELAFEFEEGSGLNTMIQLPLMRDKGEKN